MKIHPLALRLANAVVLPRPRRFDIVLTGKGYPDWEAPLSSASPVWPRAHIRSVSRGTMVRDAPNLLAAWRRLVIPLLETDAANAPESNWGLVPSRDAVASLANKAQFARYARDNGLSDLVPADYRGPGEIVYPAVVKRHDLASGNGVAIVSSPDDLGRVLATPPFVGHPTVVQQFVDGPEFTAHCVLDEGLVLWACAYRHHTAPNSVRRPRAEEPTDAAHLDDRDRADFARLLAPLSYCGPANIDFKRRADGRIIVLEINPRFGGSLFRPQNRTDLATALATIIDNARWRGFGSGPKQTEAERTGRC